MSPEISRDVLATNTQPSGEGESVQMMNVSPNVREIRRDFAVPLSGAWDGPAIQVDVFTYIPENNWHPELDD